MILKTEQIHKTNHINILIYVKTMSEIKKLLSEKNKPMLGYKGYIYTIEKTKEDKIIFRCKNRDCKGKLKK